MFNSRLYICHAGGYIALVLSTERKRYHQALYCKVKHICQARPPVELGLSQDRNCSSANSDSPDRVHDMDCNVMLLVEWQDRLLLLLDYKDRAYIHWVLPMIVYSNGDIIYLGVSGGYSEGLGSINGRRGGGVEEEITTC